MNSRNGYDAIAIRSRATVGNCSFGPASAGAPPRNSGSGDSSALIPFNRRGPLPVARKVPSRGHTPAQTNAPAAEPAARSKNLLRVVRVVCPKTAPVYQTRCSLAISRIRGLRCGIARSADFYNRVFGWTIRKRGDGSTAFDNATGEVSGA